jgi:hypothetical protein
LSGIASYATHSISKLSQAIHNDNQAIKDNTAFVREAIPALKTGVDAIQQDQSRQQLHNILEWISSTDFPAQ